MTEQSLSRAAKRRVDLQAIETRPAVFQFRHSEAYERHVSDLVRVLQRAGSLDALTLWHDPATGSLVLVDGHHRLAAYRQLQWTKKVPAVVHHCSLDEARLLALDENTKTRLPLTNAERADVAWRLVCFEETYSRREIVRASGKSDGTVSKMRRTRKQLLELREGRKLPSSWSEALSELRRSKRREYSEDDIQAWINAAYDALDDQIGKALGEAAQNNTEATCRLVVYRLGRQAMRQLFEDYAEEYGYVCQEYTGEDDCMF